MKSLFTELDIPGPDLLLRDYGRRAFPILEKALRKVSVNQSLSLNFEDVSVIDTSFADETVVELAVRLVEGQFGDRFLILLNPSAATVDNLEGTIARRKAKVALPTRVGEHMIVIGHVEPNLMEVWKLILSENELTARLLADRLNLQISTASMRLRKLYEARMLSRREEMTSTGRQHVYEIPQ